MRALVRATVGRDGVNYLVTNHIPRRLATRAMGWFSRVEQPLVARLSLAIWRAAAGQALRLDEADRTEFRSIHDCFTRALKRGARPIDHTPGMVVSPCDGVVVAAGRIVDATLVQAKGFTYTLDELLQDRDLASRCRDGHYVTIRLTSTMYHRFHAPDDGCVTTVCHVPGDVWNVNPPALARVPRLYCRNERVIIPIALAGLAAPGARGESAASHRDGRGARVARRDEEEYREYSTEEQRSQTGCIDRRMPRDSHPGLLVLVPVGAILVGSVHLHFARLSRRRQRGRSSRVRCQASFRRGDELGYFHHGSTIIVLAPPGLEPVTGVAAGTRLQVGRPLLRHVPTPAA